MGGHARCETLIGLAFCWEVCHDAVWVEYFTHSWRRAWQEIECGRIAMSAIEGIVIFIHGDCDPVLQAYNIVFSVSCRRGQGRVTQSSCQEGICQLFGPLLSAFRTTNSDPSIAQASTLGTGKRFNAYESTMGHKPIFLKCCREDGATRYS